MHFYELSPHGDGTHQRRLQVFESKKIIVHSAKTTGTQMAAVTKARDYSVTAAALY